jgi:hypothetical protein
MTQDQKHAVIRTITCAQCRYYAWHFSTMTPALARSPWREPSWHHPSCPVVRPPTRLRPGTVLRGRAPHPSSRP